jgi:hypothetical protein
MQWCFHGLWIVRNPGAKVMIRKTDDDGDTAAVSLSFNDVMLRNTSRDSTADRMADRKRRAHEALVASLSEAESAKNPDQSLDENADDGIIHGSKRLTKKEHTPMNRTEELSAIAKADGGMAAICRQIIDKATTALLSTGSAPG